MADSTYGFKFRYRMCGKPPTIVSIVAADTATYYKGDFVSLESSEVDPAATNDTTLLGAVAETKACTDSTTSIKVIVDRDAVYGVYDATARAFGAPLDVSGTHGAFTVASVTNTDFIVVAPSTATEETLVMVASGEHAFDA
jgi:hypothetical protein